MAKGFDLRKQLKLHDNRLLKRLFVEHKEMASIDWGNLATFEISSIIKVWESMPDGQRQHFQVILQDVNELSGERGQKVLLDELEFQSPSMLSGYHKCVGGDDKALWVYLHSRDSFDSAAIFAKAESLRSGRSFNRWNGLPKRDSFIVSDGMKKGLQDEMVEFYWNKEFRGKVCHVHHYLRGGGAEFFFAYLPDWPNKCLVFDRSGELTPREESYTFNVVFIYLPKEGAIEMIAPGGKKVQQRLRQIFCRAVLGIDAGDREPEKPS